MNINPVHPYPYRGSPNGNANATANANGSGPGTADSDMNANGNGKGNGIGNGDSIKPVSSLLSHFENLSQSPVTPSAPSPAPSTASAPSHAHVLHPKTSADRLHQPYVAYNAAASADSDFRRPSRASSSLERPQENRLDRPNSRPAARLPSPSSRNMPSDTPMEPARHGRVTPSPRRNRPSSRPRSAIGHDDPAPPQHSSFSQASPAVSASASASAGPPVMPLHQTPQPQPQPHHLQAPSTTSTPHSLAADSAAAPSPAAASSAGHLKPAKPPLPTHPKPKVPAKKPALSHLDVDHHPQPATLTPVSEGGGAGGAGAAAEKLSPFSTPPGSPTRYPSYGTGARDVSGDVYDQQQSYFPDQQQQQQQQQQYPPQQLQPQPQPPRRDRPPTPPASRYSRRPSPSNFQQSVDVLTTPYIDRSASQRLPPRRTDVVPPEPPVSRAQSQRLPLRQTNMQQQQQQQPQPPQAQSQPQSQHYVYPPEPPPPPQRKYVDPREMGFSRQSRQPPVQPLPQPQQQLPFMNGFHTHPEPIPTATTPVKRIVPPPPPATQSQPSPSQFLTRHATLPLPTPLDRPEDRPGLPPRGRNPNPMSPTPLQMGSPQDTFRGEKPPASPHAIDTPMGRSLPPLHPSSFPPPPTRRDTANVNAGTGAGLGLRSGNVVGSPSAAEAYPPPPPMPLAGAGAGTAGAHSHPPPHPHSLPPPVMGLSRASTFADSRSSYGASPSGNAGSVLPPPPTHPATNMSATAPAATTSQAPPQRRPTTKFDSDESDEPPVAPQSLGTVAVAQQSSLPPLSKGEFPDPSNVNRRPPYFGYSEWAGIDTKLDTRQIDVCGQYAVTTGFFTNVWDLLNGAAILTISHTEANKCSACCFKPASNLEDEGRAVWLGTITGEIVEVDVATQLTTATRQLLTRREIVKLIRYRREMWIIDGEGYITLFLPDDEGGDGSPNLNGEFYQAVDRVPFARAAANVFTMVVEDHLWYVTGKEIRIFDPHAADVAEFRVLKQPLPITHAGDVTAGAYAREQGMVYLGHADGKISVYSATDLTLQRVVASSVYKITGMLVLDRYLWAGYTTGTICVFDTTPASSPWALKKAWAAHKDGICSLVLDPRSLAKVERLQVVSLGVDKHIRVWDGLLHEDWLEERMRAREEQYCDFGKITAAVLTWNAGANVPNHLKDTSFIRDAIHPEDPPDIIVFGFQELVDLENKKITAKSLLKSKKKDKDRDPDREHHMSRQYRVWKEYLTACVDQMMPAHATYTHLHTANLIGLFTCVFVRNELRASVKDLGSMQVKRGMGGLHGNKGALVLRFLIEDTSICLVNCHLAAGQTHTASRNNDIAGILEAGTLPVETSSSRRLDRFVCGGDGSQILDHEVCILNGDLNYRIDSVPRNTVVDAVAKNNLQKLLDRDQLLASRRKNPTFKLRAFREEPIAFAPTYKYDVGTDKYDTSEKKRAPAWCDRLLYRGAGRVKQIEYRRHENQASDHRPVSGLFRIRIKTVRHKERAEVWELCHQEWHEESKRLKTLVSLEYLVGFLGLEYEDAKKRLLTA